MDEARAAESESEWSRLPLPERHYLRPLRRWPSRQPMFVFVMQFASPAALWLLARPLGFGGAEVVVVMLAFLLAIVLASAARRVDVAMRARARDRNPHEPWIHDHDWDARGETRTWFVRMTGAMGGRAGWRRYAVLLLFMLAMVLGAARVGWAATACFGAIATIVALAAWRIHGAGDAHLAFAKFPFHPGEPVTLFFGMEPGGAQFRRVEFYIAHVEEFAGGVLKMERGTRRRFTGHDRRPPGPLPGPDFDVEVSFDVPAEAPGTCISTRFPRYWVLDIRGETTSGPYAETFLVPIYERPARAASPGPKGAA